MKHKHFKNIKSPLPLAAALIAAALSVVPCSAGTGKWRSSTTGSNITYTTTEAASPAKDASGKFMTVVYLENLACEKIGQNSNADDVAWLLSQGYRVIELDYAGNDKTVSPNINADIIAINDQLNKGKFCGCSNISTSRAYILFEGYRIQRDVSYCLDDPSVYNFSTAADSLYMDIVYPANPKRAVPTMLSFSYSNSWHGNEHKRLYLGYTLSMFDDSILEGLPAIGFAWAIADHPKYCDWGKGKYNGGADKTLGTIEVCPDAAWKVKSAVRTLRFVGRDLGLGSDVGVYGFSRGSTAASLAIGDTPFDGWLSNARGREDAASESSDVQVAVLGPGVFDYGKMARSSKEYTNMTNYCTKAGGKWNEQGGALAIGTSAAPCFLFYNSDDDSNYATQATNLMTILDSAGVSYSLLKDFGKGHAVPTSAADIRLIYDFLLQAVPTGIETPTASAPSGRRGVRGSVYNLRGQRVGTVDSAGSLPSSLPRGIYIVDGKTTFGGR